MRINGLFITALISLGVAIAYDKYGQKAGGLRKAA